MIHHNNRNFTQTAIFTATVKKPYRVKITCFQLDGRTGQEIAASIPWRIAVKAVARPRTLAIGWMITPGSSTDRPLCSLNPPAVGSLLSSEVRSREFADRRGHLGPSKSLEKRASFILPPRNAADWTLTTTS